MPEDRISLTLSGTKRDLTLARDNYGACMFRCYDLAQDPQNHTLPLYEQSNWSGGMGEGTYSGGNRYATGSCIDTGYPNQIFLGGKRTQSSLHSGSLASTPTAFCVFGGIYYMVTTGGVLYSWSVASSHWDAITTTIDATPGTFEAPQRNGLCVHGGYMFLAQGADRAYLYTADGTAWTTCTETDHHADGFLSAPSSSGTTTVLWKFNSTNQVASNATGLNGSAWSTPAYVGTTAEIVNSIFVHQGRLLIGTTYALYHYDTDGSMTKLLETIELDTTSSTGSNNFMHSVSMNGSTYFAMGRRIGQITASNTFRYVEPTNFVSNTSESVSNAVIEGLAADGRFLYAIVYNTNGNVIYKGQESQDGAYWSWCPWLTMDGYALSGILCSPNPANYLSHHRLWWGELDSGPLYYANYIDLIPYDAETTAYIDHSYAATGYLDTGWIDCGHRDWYKLVDSVLAECKASSGSMSADKYVKLYYATDDSSSFTAIDTTITSATMGSKKYMDSAPISAKKVKFRVYLASNDSTVTPVVKYVAAYGSVRPPRVTQFDFTVLAEGGLSGHPETLSEFLGSCRDATTLITLTDRFEDSHYVRILPGYPQERELINEAGQPVGIGIDIRAEKVDWS